MFSDYLGQPIHKFVEPIYHTSRFAKKGCV